MSYINKLSQHQLINILQEVYELGEEYEVIEASDLIREIKEKITRTCLKEEKHQKNFVE